MAAVSCLTLVAACSSLIGSDPPADNATIFDQVWTEFDEHYSSFIVKGVDWNDARVRYRPRAIAAANELQLATVLSQMLNELRDVHVTLFTRTTEYGYKGFEANPYFFDAALIFRSYVPTSERSSSRNMRWGRIGSLGYVWIPTFGGSGWDGEIETAIERLGTITGLIIDIRDNPGGSNSTSNRIAGRFVSEERLSLYTRFRNGPGHDDFTDFYGRTVVSIGRRFEGRTLLLTSRRNFSAAEDFVLAMRQAPNVTTVGDTTGGGVGHPLYRELPNGWTYRLSESLTYTPDRTLAEGVGLAPQVFVRQSPGKTMTDEVLEHACGMLGLVRCGQP